MKQINYLRKDGKTFKYLINTLLSIIIKSNSEIKPFFEHTLINLSDLVTAYSYTPAFSYKTIFFISLNNLKSKESFGSWGDKFEKEFIKIFDEWFYTENLFIKFNSSKKEFENILNNPINQNSSYFNPSLPNKEPEFNLWDKVEYRDSIWNKFVWTITAYKFDKELNKFLYKTSFTEDVFESRYKENSFFTMTA